MADDDRVVWRLANRHGIWKRANGSWHPEHNETALDQWNAGRVNDVLISPDNAITIASDWGGIWRMTGSGDAPVCVSDNWAHSQFNSLAQGPDGAEHIFAGGEALYMTDLSRPLPTLDWIELKSVAAQFSNAGFIYDVLILRGSRIIVLACSLGVLWARIPPAPPKPAGCLAALLGLGSPPAALDTFTWRQAKVENATAGGFFSLAESARPENVTPVPRAEFPIVETIMAGGLGNMGPAGPFWGAWEAGELVLQPAALFRDNNDLSDKRSILGRTMVTSFAPNRNIGYALPTDQTIDRIFGVFKTVDGGRNWVFTGEKLLRADPELKLAEVIGHQVNSRNLCIGLSNADQDIVAIGANDPALSFDGGQTWQQPAHDNKVKDQRHWITDHLHPDLTSAVFAIAGANQNSFHVTSDGGLAQVRWGIGAWIIESDFRENLQNGNLYAVVLEGHTLTLFNLSSRGNPPSWTREATITMKATDAGCLIQSSFKSGDSEHGNLEVVVVEGNDLVHYWCAIQQGKYANWQRGGVITSDATGPGCIIQSDFGGGDHGNFEVVALEGTNLVHYWHDNSNVASPWQRGATITSKATAAGCIIQSDFLFGGDHGNFEVVVLEGADLVHYSHDNSDVSLPWSGPTLITNQAAGSARIFQADYKTDDDAHTNFELIVKETSVISHWIRNNSDPAFPWERRATITAAGHKAFGPGCAFQGSYGTDEIHGNFELLVPEDGGVVHYVRDNGQAVSPWLRTHVLTESDFTFRSDYNRRLANLQFFGTFGASVADPAAVVGPTQDNGNVFSVVNDDGTPWFQLNEGDGVAAFFLRGDAGTTVLNENNGTTASRSAHWDSGRRELIPDNNQPTNEPGVQDVISVANLPAPERAKGLVHEGHGQVYCLVEKPEKLPNGSSFLALAAQKSAIYALARLSDGSSFLWEYQLSVSGVQGVDPITAIGSANGVTAIVSALTTDKNFTTQYWCKFFLVNLVTKNVSAMMINPARKENPSARTIAMVSEKEAYAIVNGIQIWCWNGSEWLVRASPPLSSFDLDFVDIAVDTETTPPTIFVASRRAVYISRDSANSWQRASKNLPASIWCEGIQCVRDSAGAHAYLATFGRSVWIADAKEGW
jgi:hypothetical protein